MKKKYEKPVMKIEVYQLSSSIAACTTKVSYGPYIPGYNQESDACSEYLLNEGEGAAASYQYSGGFYTTATCTCYHSLGSSTLTSSW